MNPLVREWVEKAEADLITAERELHAEHRPNYDASCFHAQQCAEKYLKASLQQHGIRFEKTHNLVYLLDLILPAEPDWGDLRDDLQELSVFAVAIRYPGESAGEPEASRAVRLGSKVRDRVRTRLGID